LSTRSSALLEQLGALIGAVHGVRLAAIEKIEIGHGVVVIGAEFDGFFRLSVPSSIMLPYFVT